MPIPGFSTASSGLLAPTTPVRWAERPRWRAAIGGGAHGLPGGISVLRPITARGLPRGHGRALTPSALPPSSPPIQPHPWRIVQGGQVQRTGRVWTPEGLAPAPSSAGSIVQWHIVTRAHPGRQGHVLTPSALPPSAPPVQPHPWKITAGGQVKRRGHVGQATALPPEQPPLQPHPWKITAGGQIKRRGHVAQPSAIIPAPPPAPPPLPWKITAGGQTKRRGHVAQASSLPPSSPPIQPHPWTITKALTPRRAGRVTIPVGLALEASSGPAPLRGLMVRSGRPWRAGRIITPRPASFGDQPPYTLRPGLMVRREESRIRRRAGWLLRWLPVPLEGAVPAAGFNVYSNSGSGPIDYSTPVATVYTLSWTSPSLSYPGDWKFGVRAFNGNGEEKNLDCSVEIVLDSSGADITNRPLAPIGLRALAMAAAGVRVEWTYANMQPAKTPTGFHVYIASCGPGTLSPVAPVARAGTQSYANCSVRWIGDAKGRPTTPIAAMTASRPGSARWRGAIGSSLDYAAPAATVSYQSAIAGSWVANLAGLTSGVTYTIGVRAYNATAEEPNTNVVTVTADAVGPSSVVSLTAAAVAG